MSKRIFYTINETCERLGISRMTFYRLVKNGELITYRIGKRQMVKRSDLQEWIEDRKRIAKKND